MITKWVKNYIRVAFLAYIWKKFFRSTSKKTHKKSSLKR